MKSALLYTFSSGPVRNGTYPDHASLDPLGPPSWALSSCCAADMALKVPLKLGRKVSPDKSKCKAAAKVAKLNGDANGMATGHLSVLGLHFSCTLRGPHSFGKALILGHRWLRWLKAKVEGNRHEQHLRSSETCFHLNFPTRRPSPCLFAVINGASCQLLFYFSGAACQTRLTCKRITIKIKLITHFIRLYRVRLTEWPSSTCPNVLRGKASGGRRWVLPEDFPRSAPSCEELSYYLLPNWLMDECNLQGGNGAQSLKVALWFDPVHYLY